MECLTIGNVEKYIDKSENRLFRTKVYFEMTSKHRIFVCPRQNNRRTELCETQPAQGQIDLDVKRCFR